MRVLRIGEQAGTTMRLWRNRGQKALAALLCLSLLVWSIMPSIAHAQRIADTLQEHAQTIAEHGHSHAVDQDLLWALHGHSHDAVDHDHGHAMAALGDKSDLVPGKRDTWSLRPSRDGPYRLFLIERPPRA